MTSFKEFEKKYLVSEQFDAEQFFSTLRGLGAPIEKHLVVTDTYYKLAGKETHIFRHRHDEEIQQFTVKSYGGDTRDRLEINLNLKNDGSQKAAISAFLEVLGEVESFGIQKTVDIFDFPDCEIVHYVAEANERHVRCVEFEAVGTKSWEEAAKIIEKYAKWTGFAETPRCEHSLFDLLSSEVLLKE